jgi:molybdopterin adenylyltransferase
MKEVPSHLAHRHEAPSKLTIMVISVSDTRNLATDRSGARIVSMLEEAGHKVLDRSIVPDEDEAIEAAILLALGLKGCDAVLLTGGTGLSPRDRTAPVVESLCEQLIPGFGELFRMLSYDEIGAAAMLSRAMAGTRGQQAILAMPGSTGAVELAMKKLVLPELGHILREVRRGK